MASMFETQQGSRGRGGLPDQQSSALQQAGASDLPTQQNWDAFHQHLLLVVQATYALRDKLNTIFNP